MKARVLVADDSATMQKTVELTLGRVGVELVQARSAEEAMRKAREMKPDLMLIDHSMPDRSGQDLCAAFRKDHNLKGVPIILMAGASSPVDAAAVQRVGASDVVTKPFDSQTLIGKVKHLLRGAGLQDEEGLKTERVAEPEPLGVEAPEEMLGEEIRLPADVMAQAPSDESIPTYDLPVAEGEELTLGKPVHEDVQSVPTPGVRDLRFEDMATAMGIQRPGARTRDERPVELGGRAQAGREAPAMPVGSQTLTVPPELVKTLAREVAEQVATHMVRELRAELLDRVNKVLWEVVPDLAEQLISQELQRIRDLVEGKQ
ncbi:MAG TPA: response regulator [Candidatus Methylomirabilis sp.]|nr:response regulator [Candidatus Methylomirabilis sp.]